MHTVCDEKTHTKNNCTKIQESINTLENNQTIETDLSGDSVTGISKNEH